MTKQTRSKKGTRRAEHERVRCPLCGAEVSALFGLADHQRGARCTATRKALALQAEGLERLHSQVAAALLLDPVLAPLVQHDVVGMRRKDVGVGSYEPVQGYWAPSWMVQVLNECNRWEDGSGIASNFAGYTATASSPDEPTRVMLRAIAQASDDEREAYACALMLGGVRAALDLMRAPEGDE